jgi:predicted transcriptional regulator
MAFDLTVNSLLAKSQINLEPLIVFTIDGIPYIFSASTITEFIKIGDPDLLIGDYLGEPWYIGDSRAIEGQKDYISFSGGTSTRTTQQLQPDKGIGSSVTQLTISVVDKNEEISELISPGFVVSEILGRECKVQIGFKNTNYPEDYITVFRGIIEDITSGAGLITFNLSSTEQKKRTSIFTKATAELGANISNVGSVSTITVDDATPFLVRQLGPDGTYDSSITYYVKINDEYFSYTGKTGTTLTGVTRNPSPFNFGQQSHVTGDAVLSMVRLQGNGIDLARKILFSGKNGNFSTGNTLTNFVRISVTDTVSNSIFFLNQNVVDLYGIVVGDYITTTGASNGANNVTLKQITEVNVNDTGSYIVVSGVTFVEENDSAATISFRSQWDTLGDGCSMGGYDVDETEFESIYQTFLSSFDLDFRLTDTVTAKDFIEEQILRPMGCFSILRKGRVSLGFHTGPIPGANLLKLDQSNILNARNIKIRRSLSKNYYNSVIFNLEKDISSNEYLITKTTVDSTSISDFNVGQRSIQISSDGMRDSLQGVAKASQTSTRFLNRYKRAAEYIDSMEIHFGDGYSAEIGDIVLVDTNSLSITDIQSGTRSGAQRVFQIINKTLDFKTGKITLGLVDTNFASNTRYGLISPVSKIKSATSGTTFVIEQSYNSVYGVNEYLKWQRFGRIKVKVRNDSGSTSGTAWITGFSGNTVFLETTLGFTPSPGMIMELDEYNNATDEIKFLYAFMSDVTFADGKEIYKMI